VKFSKILIETKAPLGVILTGVAILLTMVSCSSSSTAQTEGVQNDPPWASLRGAEYRDAALKPQTTSDPVLVLYRNDSSREEVISFFQAIVHSREVASIILEQASEFNVPPSLAFALSWEESRFDPRAVNWNSSSVDRGLFQLNSKSFPKLKEKDFYDPGLNARYGIAHLRWCLDLAGSEVAGLAMYNAGTNRVNADSTPRTTLDYVSRIQSYRSGIDALFQKDLAARWIIVDGDVKSAVGRGQEAKIASARFPLLKAFH
jgi:soluble lytic murein transglycosylase-like protein